MCKQDLVLNNLQWLICHKTQPNQSLRPNQYDTMSKFKHCTTVFSFIRSVVIPRSKSPTALLFIHSWRENSCIHAFPRVLTL